MGLKFDRYTWQARTPPVYLVGAPAVLAVASILPEGFNLSFAGASSLVLVPFSYFLSQVSADAGRRLKTHLWNSWGGPLTTRFLMHGNGEFNAVTRLRFHDSLRALGLRIPTAATQEADPDGARELYASAVDEFRRLTRDATRFPLVFTGNVEYGFRRNLLGMKTMGIGVAFASLLTSGWWSWRDWATASVFPTLATVATLLIGCILFGWLLRVRADAVRLTADRSARCLLEAAGNLEAK